MRVPVAEREVEARLWRAQVGHVSVYLLDTNTAANNEADRDITFRLYGGDESHRIKQEMVLGIGGVRALRALGLAPAVWHMNEGHAAFLTLELLREQLAAGRSFEAGLEAIAAQSVFTTHTPVAAGHDAFHDHLFIAHFGAMARSMGVTVDRLLELGRAPGVNGWFNMTRLALNGARRINGVSRIHGGVSSQLCARSWPEIPPAENPRRLRDQWHPRADLPLHRCGPITWMSACRNGAIASATPQYWKRGGPAARRARSGPPRRT